MQFDDTMLTRLEKLSMLSIEAEKRTEMMAELKKIVEFVEVLSELDTDTLDPAFSNLESGTPMRDDTPNENPETRKIILQNAPEAKAGFFTVPAIIE